MKSPIPHFVEKLAVNNQVEMKLALWNQEEVKRLILSLEKRALMRPIIHGRKEF